MSIPANVDKNSRGYLMNLYQAARSNLLLVVIFSFVNTLLLVLDANVYFLFSASFPYYAVAFGHGMSIGSGNPVFYYVALGLAIVIIALYLLCWFLSKKNRGWLLLSVILFGIDCVIMVGTAFLVGFEVSMTLDFVFHIWVMVSLIRGYSSGVKASRLPADSPVMPAGYAAGVVAPSSYSLPDSAPLHPIDLDAKPQVLIETVHGGMSVQVLRSEQTTQFVVNNMVYIDDSSSSENTYSWDIRVCGIPFHYESSADGLHVLSSNGEELARTYA